MRRTNVRERSEKTKPRMVVSHHRGRMLKTPPFLSANVGETIQITKQRLKTVFVVRIVDPMAKRKGFSHEEFKSYLTDPLSVEQLELLYRANLVCPVRAGLYKEFFLTLFHLVHKTYPGDDVMTADEWPSHFKFAWNKTVDIFAAEGYLFNGQDITDYFESAITDGYYKLADKRAEIVKMITYYAYIFDLNQDGKTQSDVDNLIELYRMMGKSYTLIDG